MNWKYERRPLAPLLGALLLGGWNCEVITALDRDQFPYAGGEGGQGASGGRAGAGGSGGQAGTGGAGDECATNNGGCSVNATCTNTPGSRTCACNSPFTGNGVTCSFVATFTTCSKTGRTGPSQAECDTAYTGTPLQGNVTLSSGYQKWTAFATGTYRIEAYGASGANAATYGRGAVIKGDFTLDAGDNLWILVGQAGSGTYATYTQIGGGGGTFVSKGTVLATSQLLVAAGGGGAAGFSANTLTNGSSSTSGSAGYNNGGEVAANNAGGTNGAAGGVGNEAFSGVTPYGMSAAAGISQDGSTSQGFFTGGLGASVLAGANNGPGGFGGGGAQSSSSTGSGYASCGGGGGYSGGGASDTTNGYPAHGGGGGSFRLLEPREDARMLRMIAEQEGGGLVNLVESLQAE